MNLRSLRLINGRGKNLRYTCPTNGRDKARMQKYPKSIKEFDQLVNIWMSKSWQFTQRRVKTHQIYGRRVVKAANKYNQQKHHSGTSYTCKNLKNEKKC